MHAAHDAEDRGVGADAEAEGEDDGEGEAAGAQEAADGVAQVGDEHGTSFGEWRCGPRPGPTANLGSIHTTHEGRGNRQVPVSLGGGPG